MANTDILKDIIELCRKGSKEASKEDIKELKKQLDFLKEITSSERDTREESNKWWSDRYNLGVAYWYKKNEQDSLNEVYKQALHAITKILDILRGESLTITIQKVQRDSNGKIIKIDTYTGKESDLILKYNEKYNQVEYDLQESIKFLKKESNKDDAYVRHYQNFYNIAREHTTRRRESWKQRVNEGHIIEAYQRHLEMKHKNQNNFKDEVLNVPEVIVLLYYSLNNTGWWQQGDINYMQVKGENTKLASAASIRRVSAKILQLFSDGNNFNETTFNEMFTAQDQKEMMDFSELSEEEQKKIAKDITSSKTFKNITQKAILNI